MEEDGDVYEMQQMDGVEYEQYIEEYEVGPDGIVYVDAVYDDNGYYEGADAERIDMLEPVEVREPVIYGDEDIFGNTAIGRARKNDLVNNLFEQVEDIDPNERLAEYPDRTEPSKYRSLNNIDAFKFADLQIGRVVSPDHTVFPHCDFDEEVTAKIRAEVEKTNPDIMMLPELREAIDRHHEYEEVLPEDYELTPLPDKNFTRRSTGDAGSVGLHALALLCKECMFAFRTKTAFAKHLTLHRTSADNANILPRTQILCPKNCDIRSDCLATLVEHVRVHHKHPELVFESIEFSSIEQFKVWKSDMERLTMTRYTRSSGKHNVFSKSTYFHCHHSGNGPTQREGVTFLRNRQSKKLGRSCTAFFHIKEHEDGKVSLRGCVKHIGHELNAQSTPMSEDLKKEIAAYLLEGMSEHEIVDALRNSSESSDRRHYIQAYEVRNVHRKIMRHTYSLDQDVESDEEPVKGLSKRSVPVEDYEGEADSPAPAPTREISDAAHAHFNDYDDDLEYEEGDEIDVVGDQHIRKCVQHYEFDEEDEAPCYAAVEEVATTESYEEEPAPEPETVELEVETEADPVFEVISVEDDSPKPGRPKRGRKPKRRFDEIEKATSATPNVTTAQLLNPRAFTRQRLDPTGRPAKRGPKPKQPRQ